MKEFKFTCLPCTPHSQTAPTLNRRCWQGLAVLLALTTSSCTLLDLEKNVQKINAQGVVTAEISPVPATPPTYALAWTPAANGTNEMIGFQTVGTEGVAVFLLLQTRSYSVGAFTDLNGNHAYDGGEPMAYIKNVRPTPLSSRTNRAQPHQLHLAATNGLPPGQGLVLPRQNEALGSALSVTIGKIADLDSAKFSAETGQSGMWKPYDFLHDQGIGVYFIERYDPKKVPVLFVYGISGSSQDWRPSFNGMDRRKYQPWFFQYPGGFSLDKSANALAGAMILLQQQYGFERMALVAHCMGGLVARGAIQRAAAKTKTNFVYEFVSIATPWNGHEAAALGVKHLNFPVPAWRDMVPGSDYLKDILAQPLPAGTRHDLIFGFKSSGGLCLPDDNDGVVGVASQLVPAVQQEAASVFGLHFDHAEILVAAPTITRLERALTR